MGGGGGGVQGVRRSPWIDGGAAALPNEYAEMEKFLVHFCVLLPPGGGGEDPLSQAAAGGPLGHRWAAAGGLGGDGWE